MTKCDNAGKLNGQFRAAIQRNGNAFINTTQAKPLEPDSTLGVTAAQTICSFAIGTVGCKRTEDMLLTREGGDACYSSKHVS